MSRPADLEAACIDSADSLRQALAQIDRNRRGAVLVVDDEGRLVDLLTDGDVRRALLAGVDLDEPVSALRARRERSASEAPVAARAGTPDAALLGIMQRNAIRPLPLLDRRERVRGLVTLEELLPRARLPVEAVIMAGGEGARLRPLTEDTPKPMLPVGDRPLLEHTIERLRSAGIAKVRITTRYKADKITQHFGNGTRFGVEMQYVSEGRPLGTAGSLAHLGETDDPVLVINGDVLTNVDYRALLAYHGEQKCDLTVATRRHEVEIPYGVVECDGSAVRRIVEKPVMGCFVNAGIYVLQPSALELVPATGAFHMTDLIEALIERGRGVANFPIHEYWIDIGQHPDYARAQEDARSGRLRS